MLQHVKVTAHPVIPEAEVSDLAPVTVVCGPNNSGKSTFLEALTNDKYCVPGRRLGDEHVETLFKDSVQTTGWRGDPNQRGANEAYRLLLQEAIESKRVWYKDEVAQFVERVQEAFRQHRRLGRWGVNAGRVGQSLEGILTHQVKSVLLPPKRSLQLSAPIDSTQGPQSDGTGITNFLLRAKNRPSADGDNKTYRKMLHSFEEVSRGFSFDLFIEDNTKLGLHFRQPDGSWLPAGDCGLGLQDLLVLLLFTFHKGHNLICIEEPESHLHPDMQRRLLSVLRSVDDRQFILTTHSNVFLDNSLVDRVLVTAYTDGGIHIGDVTSRASLLDDLGYSVADNLVSDLVILVEGPTDVPILEEMFVKMGVWGEVNIKIWPLGGDIMDQLDLSVFAESYDIIALLDKDPGSSKVRKRFAKQCRRYGIEVHTLKRYAIENYFTLAALRRVFGAQMPEGLESIDPRRKLESQISFNPKRRNRQVAREMALKDIDDTDLGAFLKRAASLARGGL